MVLHGACEVALSTALNNAHFAADEFRIAFEGATQWVCEARPRSGFERNQRKEKCLFSVFAGLTNHS